MDLERRQANDKQRLRTKVQNIEKKDLLPGVEIVGTDRAEDDVEALNEESDEVDGDLEVAIEEEKNHVDVAEICLSRKMC